MANSLLDRTGAAAGLVPGASSNARRAGQAAAGRHGGATRRSGAQPLTICLAILTTGARPEALRACLRGVAALDIPTCVSLDVLLVRNGTDKPELDLADEAVGSVPVSVACEPRRGIPFGRNLALQHATDRRYDHLAFIDDDASPDPHWLRRSLAVLGIPGTDAVTGPQVPVFPPQTPPYLRDAEIYRERRLAHASVCSWAATNNVIFSVDFTSKHRLRFNEAFLGGGSDKEFFMRFTHAGGLLRWASDAIVREPVVAERLSAAWAIRRAWRLGATGYQMEGSIRNRLAAASVSIVKGAAYFSSGLLMLMTLSLFRRSALIDGACRMSRGIGFVAGAAPAFRPRRYI